MNVIERFLPAQISEDELKEELRNIIAELGVNSAAEIGKVMGVATKKLSGKADGKTISTLVKTLLS